MSNLTCQSSLTINVKNPAPTYYWHLDTLGAGIVPESIAGFNGRLGGCSASYNYQFTADNYSWLLGNAGQFTNSINCTNGLWGSQNRFDALATPPLDLQSYQVGFTCRIWAASPDTAINGGILNLDLAYGLGTAQSSPYRFMLSASSQWLGNFSVKYFDPNYGFWEVAVVPGPGDTAWHRIVLIWDRVSSRMGVKIDDGATNWGALTDWNNKVIGLYLPSPTESLILSATGVHPLLTDRLLYCDMAYWAERVLTDNELHLDWNNGLGLNWPW